MVRGNHLPSGWLAFRLLLKLPRVRSDYADACSELCCVLTVCLQRSDSKLLKDLFDEIHLRQLANPEHANEAANVSKECIMRCVDLLGLRLLFGVRLSLLACDDFVFKMTMLSLKS